MSELLVHEKAEVFVEAVRVEARLRPVSQRHVDHIANRMRASGVTSAITVVAEPGKSGYSLVDGAHRLAAAQQLGLATISAIVVQAQSGWDGYSALIEEATLNLARHELSPYDRASSVAGVYEALLLQAGVGKGESPRKLGGSARWLQARRVLAAAGDEQGADLPLAQDGPVGGDYTKAFSARDQAMAACGIGPDDFKRAVRLYRTLRADLADMMRGRDGWLVAADVHACAKLDDAGQSALADALSNHPEATLKQALAMVAPSSSDARTVEDKAVNAVEGNFSRLSKAIQVTVVARLISGLTSAQRDQLKAELEDSQAGDA